MVIYYCFWLFVFDVFFRCAFMNSLIEISTMNMVVRTGQQTQLF